MEFGEPVAEAARREAAEESGCELGELALTGAYEIFGPGHHFVMWAYRSGRTGVVPDRFDRHHVSAVRQERGTAGTASDRHADPQRRRSCRLPPGPDC